MENINQEYHCQSIVCNDSYQIIDSCNQRAGCNRRVHMVLWKNIGTMVPIMLETTMATTRERPTQPEIRKRRKAMRIS